LNILNQLAGLSRRRDQLLIVANCHLTKPKSAAGIPDNGYGSPEYLRRNGTPKSIGELSKHVFVDYLDAFVAVSEVKWLRELAPEAKIVVQSTSLIAQQQAAIAGAGLVALPTYAAIPKSSLQKILPDHSIWRDLWMTVHSDNEYLSRIRAATQFLRSRLPLFLDT
jgi:DNA-binding transcriptional LysR family regulator